MIESSNNIVYGNYIGKSLNKLNPEFNRCTCDVDVTLSTSNIIYIGGFLGENDRNDFKAQNCTIDGEIKVTTASESNYCGSLVGNYINGDYMPTANTGNTINYIIKKNGTDVNVTERFNQQF
jgi:hypothetical protein